MGPVPTAMEMAVEEAQVVVEVVLVRETVKVLEGVCPIVRGTFAGLCPKETCPFLMLSGTFIPAPLGLTQVRGLEIAFFSTASWLPLPVKTSRSEFPCMRVVVL
jgi:hypothetical protein